MKSWCKFFKLYNIQKSQTTCIVVTWEASLNRCACFCVTSDQVASSGMARSLWTGGWCETRNETKVETICLNQTAITARGDGTIILCQQDANRNTFNSIGRKGNHAWKWNFLKGWNHLKNKKHTISAKDEHVRAHCPVPNSPRSLQVNMKTIIFSVAKNGSCHQCIGWVRCLADRLIEGAYPWRQSASKVSGDAFTPWGGFFLEAFLLVQDRRLTYDVRILTCQTATSCVPHEAMGGVKTRLFVYGPLRLGCRCWG